ncbi:MAG: transcriptional regulator [Kiritimatiellae bacterium]|nr:transcriptional regulator [Kiritimatiellia bacterium]
MASIDLNDLDTTVHGPVRLGILSALQIDGPLDFWTLKKRLRAADGSLAMHLQKLEDVNYIVGKRQLVGKRQKTTYRMTATGRKAFMDYLDKIQGLIDAIEATTKHSTFKNSHNRP